MRHHRVQLVLAEVAILGTMVLDGGYLSAEPQQPTPASQTTQSTVAVPCKVAGGSTANASQQAADVAQAREASQQAQQAQKADQAIRNARRGNIFGALSDASSLSGGVFRKKPKPPIADTKPVTATAAPANCPPLATSAGNGTKPVATDKPAANTTPDVPSERRVAATIPVVPFASLKTADGTPVGPSTNLTAGLPIGDNRISIAEAEGFISARGKNWDGQNIVLSWAYTNYHYEPIVYLKDRSNGVGPDTFEGAFLGWDFEGNAWVDVGPDGASQNDKYVVKYGSKGPDGVFVAEDKGENGLQNIKLWNVTLPHFDSDSPQFGDALNARLAHNKPPPAKAAGGTQN